MPNSHNNIFIEHSLTAIELHWLIQEFFDLCRRWEKQYDKFLSLHASWEVHANEWKIECEIYQSRNEGHGGRKGRQIAQSKVYKGRHHDQGNTGHQLQFVKAKLRELVQKRTEPRCSEEVLDQAQGKYSDSELEAKFQQLPFIKEKLQEVCNKLEVLSLNMQSI